MDAYQGAMDPLPGPFMAGPRVVKLTQRAETMEALYGAEATSLLWRLAPTAVPYRLTQKLRGAQSAALKLILEP